MNIGNLVQEAHQNAVSKGWWNEDRTYGELIALVHSEVSEALEDYRNGKGINEVWYEHKNVVGGDVYVSGQPYLLGSEGKPCGIPSELADICIRIFDIAGRYEWRDDLESYVFSQMHISDEEESFAEALTGIHHDLSESWINYKRGDRLAPISHLAYAVLAVTQLADKHNVDLEQAIAEKMAYNATRPQRHGGKVI
ncbi:hypothetical protein PA598K_01423 [Paenibacillus sp. 598K]|uniref:hypothetical protein n=1 Tax=Paenibacillus sp. 598K TaxID=1117987 RepID=UPI000FF9B652|nr:hypothetical protein [Paenibacillus sp. 598K]GBF73138.1 hypothetical protein PA598K_01423 [Paenibacillus sp. 598K]